MTPLQVEELKKLRVGYSFTSRGIKNVPYIFCREPKNYVGYIVATRDEEAYKEYREQARQHAIVREMMYGTK